MKSELFYTDYQTYLRAQIRQAKRTRRRTRRYARKYPYFLSRIRQLYPHVRSLLAVGCRDDFEIEFIEKQGFLADGIDLYSTCRIIQCDMSKIHECEYFKDRRYDIVLSIRSLEHCMDLKGFVRGLNQVCRVAFVCWCPNVKRPDEWDCARHPFMKPTDNDLELERCFPRFRIRINEKHKHGACLFFILERKEVSPWQDGNLRGRGAMTRNGLA